MVRQIELDAMRAAQEAVTLGDEVRVETRTKGSYNNTTYRHPETATTVYEGPADIWIDPNRLDPTQMFVEAARTRRKWRMALPVGVETVAEGQVVVILSARDPWVPRELNVTEAIGGGFGTRRRFLCEEIE